jgi:hypothetical protein
MESDTNTPTSKYFTVSEYSTKSNDKYRIARYNKDILINDLIPSYGILRSVIFNKNNQVVSFAPVKSSLADQFITKYATKTHNIIAQEFVEGTMINVFYDSTILNWKIATRNTVDAEVYFYKKENGKTFNAMFFEACKQNNFDLEMLDKQFCYSFVLQHPDNRIVVPFKKSQLYLVAVYSIHNEQDNISVTVNDVNDFVDVFHALNTTVQFPRTYKFEKIYLDTMFRSDFVYREYTDNGEFSATALRDEYKEKYEHQLDINSLYGNIDEIFDLTKLYKQSYDKYDSLCNKNRNDWYYLKSNTKSDSIQYIRIRLHYKINNKFNATVKKTCSYSIRRDKVLSRYIEDGFVSRDSLIGIGKKHLLEK